MPCSKFGALHKFFFSNLKKLHHTKFASKTLVTNMVWSSILFDLLEDLHLLVSNSPLIESVKSSLFLDPYNLAQCFYSSLPESDYRLQPMPTPWVTEECNNKYK